MQGLGVNAVTLLEPEYLIISLVGVQSKKTLSSLILNESAPTFHNGCDPWKFSSIPWL